MRKISFYKTDFWIIWQEQEEKVKQEQERDKKIKEQTARLFKLK